MDEQAHEQAHVEAAQLEAWLYDLDRTEWEAQIETENKVTINTEEGEIPEIDDLAEDGHGFDFRFDYSADFNLNPFPRPFPTSPLHEQAQAHTQERYFLHAEPLPLPLHLPLPLPLPLPFVPFVPFDVPLNGPFNVPITLPLPPFHPQPAPPQPAPPLPHAPPPRDAPVDMLVEYAQRRGFHSKRTRRRVQQEEQEDRRNRQERQEREWGGDAGETEATRERGLGRRARCWELSTHASHMQKQDWAEVRDFLAAFPDINPLDIRKQVSNAHYNGTLLSSGITLLDLKDAWRLGGVSPLRAVLLMSTATRSAARLHASSCGALHPAHDAYVFETEVTLCSSLELSLTTLREQARSKSLRREELVAQANARAAVGHAATTSDQTLQVTPAHAKLLYDLYPGAPRGIEGVNEWIASTGFSFVRVPRYTRAPRVDLLVPLRHGAIVQPLAFEQLLTKFLLDVPQNATQVAGVLRELAQRERNPTFSYCWSTDVYPDDNDADAFLNEFKDMSPEDVVCWGTLGCLRRLSVAELTAWFTQNGRTGLDQFGESSGATYNISQGYALHDVAAGLERRAQWRKHVEMARHADSSAPDMHAHDKAEASELAARALKDRVSSLITLTLRALDLDAALVRRFRTLREDQKKSVICLFRALQELAAYCLYWKGPPHPFPRLGDPVEHLHDAVDVETTLYEKAVPPAISALTALTPELAKDVCALRVFVSPTDTRPGSSTLGTLFEQLQAPTRGEAGVENRVCVRLVARPLWQTMCVYAASFFNEALPSFECAPSK